METLSPPTLPLFFSFFITIYLFGYFKIFKSWTGICRPEASSCLISLAHGTPAFLLSTLSLHNHHPTTTFASPNTHFQNTILNYSIAYFIADTLHYLLFVPTDVLFIIHHVATLYVLATCRFLVGHGAIAILSLLALAEVTSACQNAWSLSKLARTAVSPPCSAAAGGGAVYELLSPVFYGFYTVVRGVFGPIFVYRIWREKEERADEDEDEDEGKGLIGHANTE
ncbi:TLC domain-containing protein At5g14285-like [Camellia sinensis]|uniref:TLC domain-containing protein At5g14285-like n=1 Tax=Camellia sinensis TaxID=4442 RepID=UPI001035606D|nr:TLC domain-containing protein At5g14285-like [Camellia sinensis]